MYSIQVKNQCVHSKTKPTFFSSFHMNATTNITHQNNQTKSCFTDSIQIIHMSLRKP